MSNYIKKSTRKKSTRRSTRKKSTRRSTRKKSTRKKSTRRSTRKKSTRRSTRKKSRIDGYGNTTVVDKFITKLKNANRYAKLNYKYDIDFTDEKEFKDILKEKSISLLKVKLNRYINLVKNSVLYPKVETENFRNEYLKKLLELKKNIYSIPSLPAYPKKFLKKRSINVLSPIEENNIGLSRQSSFEDSPYEQSYNLIKYKHKINPNKKRVYYTSDKYFDIEDTKV